MNSPRLNEIQTFFDCYKKAVLEKNADAFLALFDGSLHVFDMWDTWSYDGIDAWRGMVTGWFGSLRDERVAVEFENQHMVIAQDMALATAFVTFAAVSAEGKRLRSLQNRLTWVLQKKAGDWKIIHEHTSAPVNHETGKVMLHRDNPT